MLLSDTAIFGKKKKDGITASWTSETSVALEKKKTCKKADIQQNILYMFLLILMITYV
jgi:hypothetical protein